jgi:hypothetical protein
MSPPPSGEVIWRACHPISHTGFLLILVFDPNVGGRVHPKCWLVFQRNALSYIPVDSIFHFQHFWNNFISQMLGTCCLKLDLCLPCSGPSARHDILVCFKDWYFVACSSVGTMLQAGRSHVRFLVKSLDFFSGPSTSSCTMIQSWTQFLKEMNTRNLPGGKW